MLKEILGTITPFVVGLCCGNALATSMTKGDIHVAALAIGLFLLLLWVCVK